MASSALLRPLVDTEHIPEGSECPDILSQRIEKFSKSVEALFGLSAKARLCGSIFFAPKLDGHLIFPLAEGREFKSESLVMLDLWRKKCAMVN